MEKREDISGLIVTGNAFIHKYLASILEQTGVRTTCLDCGKKALEMGSESRFNMVFINEYLPDMSSLDLLGTLKARWPWAAYIMLLTHKRGLEKILNKYGVDAALVKPLKPEEVLAAVDEALALSLKNSLPLGPGSV